MTRAWLRANEATLSATLARHGVQLRPQVLQDDTRVLVAPSRPRRLAPALARLHAVLDDLQQTLRPA